MLSVNLNLRQIEVFRAVMVTGSISGAAKLLYVSQPAVSRLVAHTEQRLGFELFERIKGRLHPTPEARRLFKEVTLVHDGVLRCNEVAADLLHNRGGHLHVACSPSLGQWLVPRAVAAFIARFPDVHVVLNTMLPEVLLQAVLTQRADMGVAFLQEGHPSLACEPLHDNRLVAAIPVSHPLAQSKKVALGAVVGEPMIGYSADVPLGRLIREAVRRMRNVRPPRVEVQQTHVACALVQAGAGIALIDELTAMAPIARNITVRPVTPLICAPVTVLHKSVEPLSRLAREFVHELHRTAGGATREQAAP